MSKGVWDRLATCGRKYSVQAQGYGNTESGGFQGCIMCVGEILSLGPWRI